MNSMNMTIESIGTEEGDLECFCPDCKIPLNLYIILEGPYKGVKYYNCTNNLMCGVKDIKKGVAESYQKLLNEKVTEDVG